MTWRAWLLGGVVGLVAGLPARGQEAGDPLADVAAVLKPLLAEALPAVLYEKQENWGHQAPTPNGLTWRGLRPTVQLAARNDGRWRKIRLTAQELPRTMELTIRDLRAVDAERQTFTVDVAFQVGVEFEQQRWESGVRLASGGVRARLRLKLALACESTLRLEAGRGPLPDLVFRLRVARAAVSYDRLVVEHLAGLGGTAARVLGDAAHDALNQWRPSIERRLLERANAAIVRAADTREVRLGLGGKKKAPPRQAPG